MPNYCNNYVTFLGDPQELKRCYDLIYVFLSDQFHHSPFMHLSFDPLQEFAIHFDRIVYDFDIAPLHESNRSFCLFISTNYAPPLKWIRLVAKQFQLAIQIEYEECGSGFRGVSFFKNDFEFTKESSWDDSTADDDDERWANFYQKFSQNDLQIILDKTGFTY